MERSFGGTLKASLNEHGFSSVAPPKPLTLTSCIFFVTLPSLISLSDLYGLLGQVEEGR